MNNDFFSLVRRFGNDFHEWQSHKWKLLLYCLTSDTKILIHTNKYIVLFLTCYFMSWTHISAKNYHGPLISPRTVITVDLWYHLAVVFTRDEVTRENHCRITAWVTKKLLFTLMIILFYFFACYFMSWTHKSAKNYCRLLISPLSLRMVFSDLHCDVTTVDLWRHTNARYWYCYVIFVACHCTCKLVQRQTSLVNNISENRYPATR